jgi:hypothetical protein
MKLKIVRRVAVVAAAVAVLAAAVAVVRAAVARVTAAVARPAGKSSARGFLYQLRKPAT